MGSTSDKKEIVIGEILLDSHDEIASFSYRVQESCPLNLIVQDKVGRTMISSNYTLDANEPRLEFSISSLGAGDYHAWIYVGDEVFVRHFVIEKAAETGFLDKFRSFFK
jgi:hypothetical protein